ncbi:MAG: glycosyltransferase, partial [Lachnospiraceae bacterium]|nr:glycosyltransferase [Lachnospiraceae bacterium]
MAADWKTQAKTEYEAELYRQTHPYEQWIAENEAEDMEDLPEPGDGHVDFLVLTPYYFRGLLEGQAEDEMRKRPFGIHENPVMETGETADAVDRILEGKDIVLVVEFEPGLDPRAFNVIRAAFREHPEADVLYADEDVIDAEGKRSHPWFKPDWSPDTFRSFKYFGHIVAYRATCIRKMVRDEQWDPAMCDPTEFAIRVSTGRPLHLPQVLFHNRCDDPLGKEDVYQKVWREGSNRYENPSYPIERNGHVAKVSVIIPSKDQPKLLEQCLKGLRENTDYPEFEIIVVDNGSSDANRAEIEKLRDAYGFQYLYEKEAFNFSQMCNRGAAAATGDLLLFLNDDIEVLSFATEWMRKMAGQALLSHVGAVGAKLWY